MTLQAPDQSSLFEQQVQDLIQWGSNCKFTVVDTRATKEPSCEKKPVAQSADVSSRERVFLNESPTYQHFVWEIYSWKQKYTTP